MKRFERTPNPGQTLIPLIHLIKIKVLSQMALYAMQRSANLYFHQYRFSFCVQLNAVGCLLATDTALFEASER